MVQLLTKSRFKIFALVLLIGSAGIVLKNFRIVSGTYLYEDGIGTYKIDENGDYPLKKAYWFEDRYILHRQGVYPEWRKKFSIEIVDENYSGDGSENISEKSLGMIAKSHINNRIGNFVGKENFLIEGISTKYDGNYYRAAKEGRLDNLISGNLRVVINSDEYASGGTDAIIDELSPCEMQLRHGCMYYYITKKSYIRMMMYRYPSSGGRSHFVYAEKRASGRHYRTISDDYAEIPHLEKLSNAKQSELQGDIRYGVIPLNVPYAYGVMGFIIHKNDNILHAECEIFHSFNEDYLKTQVDICMLFALGARNLEDLVRFETASKYYNEIYDRRTDYDLNEYEMRVLTDSEIQEGNLLDFVFPKGREDVMVKNYNEYVNGLAVK